MSFSCDCCTGKAPGLNEQPFPEIPHLSCTHRGLFIIWLMPPLERMQLNLPEERPDVPIRILVVDDSEAIRQAVRACIEGHAELDLCGAAENGGVELDMVRKLNPEIVVLDLMMPGMNGLEVAREIVASAPRTRMIMFTSDAGEGLIKAAQEVGISRVIAKSGDGVANQLLAAIRGVFRERDAA
jgi:CheY-like chemotaxis protein